MTNCAADCEKLIVIGIEFNQIKTLSTLIRFSTHNLTDRLRRQHFKMEKHALDVCVTLAVPCTNIFLLICLSYLRRSFLWGFLFFRWTADTAAIFDEKTYGYHRKSHYLVYLAYSHIRIGKEASIHRI